ncbi:MAG: Fmu (Sun) domain-containing protein [Chitinophagaceae bacterium]
MKGIHLSYLQSALAILAQYHGEQPFHLFLKSYFRQFPNYGSRDRKRIAHLCYCYFRSGLAMKKSDPEEKLLASLFLCSNDEDPLLHHFHPDWTPMINQSLEQKINFLQEKQVPIDVGEIFPLSSRLSPSLPHYRTFTLSHCQQPSLFVRVRPGKAETVRKTLLQNNIQFTEEGSCFTLTNGEDVTGLLVADKEIVVQDYSSQQTGLVIQTALEMVGKNAAVWDCCAASGGKSMLAYDIEPTIDLTVSDIRNTILDNLDERFKRAGIRQYRAFETDLTVPMRPGKKYDIVIADVPCSGSGTWGRTPAEMQFFSEGRLRHYVDLQRKILTNVLSSIKPGGQLLYFTCSVYGDENEQQVQYIQDNSFLELKEMRLLEGYEKGADTLFAARFILPA